MIVTETLAETVLVVTLNEAVLEPAGTTTFAGTEAEAELLDKVTVTPPEGAAPSRVIVFEETTLPPTALVVDNVTL